MEYMRFYQHLDKVAPGKIKIFTRGYHSRYFIIPPCPFLNSEGLCRVYKFRPEICKTFPIRNGPDRFFAEFFCPEVPRLLAEQKMTLLNECLNNGISSVWRELMGYKFMPVDVFMKLKADIIELDKEVKVWLASFKIPEGINDKRQISLNLFKDISSLQEFMPELDKVEEEPKT